jgi:hypothetical protein
LAVPTSKNSSRGTKQQPDESGVNSNSNNNNNLNNNNNRNRIANPSSNRKQESQPSTQKSPTLYDYHDIYPSQAGFAINRSSNLTYRTLIIVNDPFMALPLCIASFAIYALKLSTVCSKFKCKLYHILIRLFFISIKFL